MASSTFIPDSHISTLPGTTQSISDIRPGGQPLKLFRQTSDGKSPSVTVNLLPAYKTAPVDVESVTVTGNPTRVTVQAKLTSTSDFIILKSKVPTASPIILSQVKAVALRIVLEPNADGTKPMEYQFDVSIKGCFELITTTTPAPTTVTTTTVVTTTTARICNKDCACSLGCFGAIGNCEAVAGCDRNCQCDNNPDERTNWRCAKYTHCTRPTTTPSTTTTPKCLPDKCKTNVTCAQQDDATFKINAITLLGGFSGIIECSAKTKQCGCPAGSILDPQSPICVFKEEKCTRACMCNVNGVDKKINPGESCLLKNCDKCVCQYDAATSQNKWVNCVSDQCPSTTSPATTTAACERPDKCHVTKTCDDVMDATFQVWSKVGAAIFECLGSHSCACKAGFTPDPTENSICIKQPPTDSCIKPCKCTVNGIETTIQVGKKCVMSCKTCTCGYENGQSKWTDCSADACLTTTPKPTTTTLAVCDSSKCMCSIGCFGDQSDCAYKYECDPMMCVCPSGMSRVNGRCVKSVTPDDQCTTTVTTTLPTTTRPACSHPLISVSAIVKSITASSTLSVGSGTSTITYSPEKARPNLSGWRGTVTDLRPIFTTTFKQVVTVSGITIKPVFVKTFKIEYSDDGTDFKPVTEGSSTKIFNVTGVIGATKEFFFPMVQASTVRIIVLSKTLPDKSAGFNLDILGCYKLVTTTPEPPSTPSSTYESTTPSTTTMSTTTANVCTSPKVYHSCLCHKTCEDMANANFTCPTACQAGCDCPTGTVNNNGKCVPATDCPCYYQPLGKFFKLNEVFVIDKATCKEGRCTMTDISIEIDSEKCKKCDNCTANQVCKDTCACKRTCENPDLVCDLQTCKPGCACPDKTVWNGEKCVPKYECPCKHNNTFYDQGEKWSVSECMKCKCTNNTAVCGETCTKTCSTGFKLLNKAMDDGVCCKCVPEQEHCVHPDKPDVYILVGKEVNKDACTSYECKPGPMLAIKALTCENKTCGDGFVEVREEGKCCSVCKPTQTTTTTTAATTTTTAATTTTTPAPTTSPSTSSQVCKLIDGMNNPAFIPDEYVTGSPDTPNSKPSNARPSGDGWVVPVPTSSNTPFPKLAVKVSQDGLPAFVKQIVVTGNPRLVTVSVKNTPTDEFVEVQGLIDIMPDGAMTIGKDVVEVRVTMKDVQSPSTASKPANYNVKLQVTGCFEKQRCEYNGTKYNIGDKWTKECMKCSCKDPRQPEGGVICEDLYQQCNISCDGQLVKEAGKCCPVCKPRNEICQPGFVSKTLNVNGCESIEKIKMSYCSGSCNSNATATFSAPYLNTNCKCCKPTSIARLTAKLKCANGTVIDHSYVQINSCGCEACQYNPFKAQTTTAMPITAAINRNL